MAGSGTQSRREATWYRRAREGDGASIALCLVAPWYCAVEELSTVSAEYGAAAADAAADAQARVTDGLAEDLSTVLQSAAEPLAEAASIAQWATIALIVILAFAVLALLVLAWVYWGPTLKAFFGSFATAAGA